MAKIGVIIGRFQLPNPHAGHKYLFNFVKEECDEVIILVGVAPVSFTDKNPLPYSLRSPIIQQTFSGAIVLPLQDKADDYEWSEHVDAIIDQYSTSDDKVKIYHSRDGFINGYHGKYETLYVPSTQEEVSATIIRATIGDAKYAALYGKSTAFKNGMIYTIENRFPVAYPTVDIAVLKYTAGEYDKDLGAHKTHHEILLGKKHGAKLWRLPGGFVDPGDSSLESAVHRELSEEVPGLEHHEITYIGSRKIDDWRYRGTKDGIITSLFKTYTIGGRAKAGDDLAEVKWFDLFNLEPLDIEPCHHELLQMVISSVNKKK